MENVWADLTRLLHEELERLKGAENLEKNFKKKRKGHRPKMCYKVIETYAIRLKLVTEEKGGYSAY